jgi:hypothetical protein
VSLVPVCERSETDSLRTLPRAEPPFVAGLLPPLDPTSALRLELAAVFSCAFCRGGEVCPVPTFSGRPVVASALRSKVRGCAMIEEPSQRFACCATTATVVRVSLCLLFERVCRAPRAKAIAGEEESKRLRRSSNLSACCMWGSAPPAQWTTTSADATPAVDDELLSGFGEALGARLMEEGRAEDVEAVACADTGWAVEARGRADTEEGDGQEVAGEDGDVAERVGEEEDAAEVGQR